MSVNEIIKETQRFDRILQMSERYDIWYDDDRKDIEDYIRERVSAALGIELFKVVPKDRKFITIVHESIVAIDSDIRRLKTYKMTISIVIREIK